MKPYEADAARVRAMYRVLGPSLRGRTLEVCFGAPPVLAAADWPGEHVSWSLRAPNDESADVAARDRSSAVPRWPPTPPDGAFDLIVLHRTLDRLANSNASACSPAALEALFRTLAARLAQRGILIVTVANGAWLSRFRRARRGHAPNATTDPDARLSWRRLQRLFAATGFVEVRSYNVLPDADAPLRLVDTDADLSRVGFRRELAFMQSSLPLPSYFLRRAVVELALNRHLEDCVLTLGARP